MRKQPNPGLRSFIFTMAAMSSGEGPLGPGLGRRAGRGKEQPAFPIYQRCGMRLGRTNSVVSQSTNRSSALRLGARCLEGERHHHEQ